MANKRIVLFLFLIIFLLTPFPAHAQSGFGKLLGKEAEKQLRFSDLLSAINFVSPLDEIKESVAILLPQKPQPAKKTYVIAVYGDSMVETMGENLEYLSQSLKKQYPETNFLLYNYGIGSQNVEKGLSRFSDDFSYKTRSFPPLSCLSVDIIILSSFAYNPFSPHDRDKHWLTLTQLIEKARGTGAEVYLLAEIAPLKSKFGIGLGGVNWPANLAYEHSLHITEQLENAIGLSKTLNVPLINVYGRSKNFLSSFGKSIYVSQHDGIHPSVAGHQLMAKTIVKTIKLR